MKMSIEKKLKKEKRMNKFLRQEVDMLSLDVQEYQNESRQKEAWLERILRTAVAAGTLLTLRWIIKVDNRR